MPEETNQMLIERNQVGKREMLANIIARVDAKSTPVQAMIPKGEDISNMLMEWQMELPPGSHRMDLPDRPRGRVQVDGAAWRVEDTEVGRRLLVEGGAVHVVGRLKPDDWQGREGVELEIEDVADPRRV